MLSQHKLYANKNKCSFGQPEVEYLGHVISQDGVAADKSKNSRHGDLAMSQFITRVTGIFGAYKVLPSVC